MCQTRCSPCEAPLELLWLGGRTALKARPCGDVRPSLLGESSRVICPKTRDFMKSLLQSCKSHILVEMHAARLPISTPLESFCSAQNSGIKHFQTDSVYFFFPKEQGFPHKLEASTFVQIVLNTTHLESYYKNYGSSRLFSCYY